MRELTTIGSLRTMRAIERSSRLLPMRGMGWMGQTNPNFAPPSLAQVDAHPPGPALASATLAMLSHFQSAGVPSEHVSDPFVLAFQQAWNADPAGWMQLGLDGGYGPNVHDAAGSIVDVTGGGDPPPVNSGAAPAPAPITPVTPATPATPNKVTPSGSHALLWILAIAAALGAAYAAHRLLKKRRRSPRRAALPSRAIVLT